MGAIAPKLLCIISVGFCLTVYTHAASAKTIKACTVDIPNGITETGEGPQPLRHLYTEITSAVTARTGHAFTLTFAPAARCFTDFVDGKIDMVWPFIIAEDADHARSVGYKTLPIYSMPIIMGGFYIFTREDDPALDTVTELMGKSVLSARGYGIPQAMLENDLIEKSYVATNEQVPQMLKLGRADAAIIQTGWVPILKESGLLDGTHHGEIIEFWGGAFTFQNSEEGTSLANTFSTEILKLVVDGRYQNIMDGAPYSIPAYGLSVTPN